MKEKITFQDLILFSFNETELPDTVRVRRGLESDPMLQASYDELLETLHTVRSAKLQPSEKSIRKILEFSVA